MKLRIRQEQNGWVAEVEGKVIAQESVKLGRKLEETILNAQEGSPHIVVNVAQTAYLDSQGLGALVRARQSVQARGGLMALSEAPQHILRLLEITKLSQIIPAYPNDAAALKAMRAQADGDPSAQTNA
ncbi:MAG: STAS domain-containing protein [Candidatus Poribacteria bacterium]|nr:STAS domain-containing protein [Candidatus Poribacteria bacterium]